MGYNAFNIRLGYKIGQQTGSFTKSGFMPHFLFDHTTFQNFWSHLTKEVMATTGSVDVANYMLELSRKVATWMILPTHARTSEVEDAWLMVAHRILDRLDRACHHADLAQLTIESEEEEQHAKIRAASISTPKEPARANNQRGGWGGGAASRSNQRKRNRGEQHCDLHGQCNHTTADCNVLSKKPKGK